MALPKVTEPIGGNLQLSVTWRGWFETLDRRIAALDGAAEAPAIPDAGRLNPGAGITVFGSIDYGQIATVSLATLTDSGTGAGLVKITRDAYGRVEGTEAATTDDLTEGAANLYFTDARAVSAVEASGITGGVLPMVNGDVPPTLMYAEDGSLIYFEV